MAETPEGQFVVELGADVLRAATRADARSFFDKLTGVAPPEECEVLIAGMKQTRALIQQTEGWLVPSVTFRDNSELPPNGVNIRSPAGELQYQINDLSQLLSIIVLVARFVVMTQMVENKEGKIFIGHGRSHVWRQLQDFLERRLGLAIDEFNREAVAGHSTTERLMAMLHGARFAFVVMTAEDVQPDGSSRARENVVHEIGLFQGRLGFQKAIVLLEEGCSTFSNIHGLTYISFPRNNLSAAFENVREVLEREGVLS